MIESKQVTQQNLRQTNEPLELVIYGSKRQLPTGSGGRRHHSHHHQMQENIQKYLDMQRRDPDWQFAQKHGESTKPGRPNPQGIRQECICCLREIVKQPVGLCQNSKQLQFLGYGFPLYFIFVKYSIAILLLEIINYTSIQLYWSISANVDFCMNQIPRGQIECTSFMVFLSNISQHLTSDEHIIRLTSFTTLLLTLVYVRDQFTKTWLYYGERQATYSDFSILIEKIPSKEVLSAQSKTIGQRIRSFFADQQIFPQKLKIAKIIQLGKLQTLQKLEDSKKQLADKLQHYAQKNKGVSYKVQSNNQMGSMASISQQFVNQKRQIRKMKSDLRKQIEEKINQIKNQKIRLKQLIQNEDLDCDTAIVCFQHQVQKQSALILCQDVTKERLLQYFQSSKIKISAGPEPHQVIWENMNVSRSLQRKRFFISWAIFLAILTSVTVGFYFLLNFKNHEVRTADDSLARTVSYISLLAIIISFYNQKYLTNHHK